MILYFSGTGNSRYAAQLIGQITGDEAISVNALIKKGGQGVFRSELPYVFVCPAYAWRIPRVFEKFIREARLSGATAAYFVLTCGGQAGNAAHYARKLCREKGLVFMGLAGIVMPENYIARYDVPDQQKSKAIIEKAVPHIMETAGYIKNSRPLPEQKITLIDRVISGIVNDIFYPFCVKAKGFYATDACVACGKCAELCPLNNVRLEGGKPSWGDNCTHCMACICSCPTEAIEYKNISKGKPRYNNTLEPPKS